LKLDLASSVVHLTDVYANILRLNSFTLTFSIQNEFPASVMQKYNSESSLFPLPSGNLPKCYMS